jgi:hypothetical protein
MKNVFCFLKATGVAMVIMLCSFVSTELHSMDTSDNFPVQFKYVIPKTKKVTLIDAEVKYAGTYVNGDDLYVAAQTYAPENENRDVRRTD